MEKTLLNKDSLISRRIGAFITDQILIGMIIAALYFINFNKTTGNYNYYVELFPKIMFAAISGFLCKDVFYGTSIGKLLFGIHVREYGNLDKTPKFYQLIFRNVLTFIWFVEFFIMLNDREGRRLGDKLAKTQVIGYQNKVALRIIAFAIITSTLYVSSLVIGITYNIKNDASYKDAVEYIKTEKEIIKTTGEIKGFGYITPANFIYRSDGWKTAYFDILVIGKTKKIVVHVRLDKTPGADWDVRDIKY